MPIIFAVAVCTSLTAFPLHAQQGLTSNIEVRSLTGEGTSIRRDMKNNTIAGSNGVFISYEGSVLVANSVFVNESNGEAIADGRVRIQKDDQIWVGEHMRYNFLTRQIISDEFRSGRPPVFMSGKGLHGNVVSNQLADVTATNAIITTDDVDKPEIELRATRMKIIPNVKLQAWNAVLYMHGIPMFYFPYYERNLGPHANNFNAVPGYTSQFGPYILGQYTWWLNDDLSGRLHLDYREKRGPGVGPDIDYNMGRWGKGTLSYYYTHDHDPQTNFVDGPVYQNRQRVYFSYQALPYTNLELHALARYESDAGVNRDFFERDYRDNPQPNTFIEADKKLQNFSVDVLTQPRVNDFLETVERLPDVRVTGFRQQLWNLPFYYESESTAGYYRRLFADTNAFVLSTNFEAARADTFHQVTLPITLFGWLNVVPRVGGRFTYYSEASGPGASTDEVERKVFNTGAEVSFKVSRLWEDAHCSLLAVDGLRHIIEPSANYIYIPTPNATPNQLPQFDYELPSLALLPIEFPGFNSIDSINSQNAIRWGLRNQLQTKRDGQLEDLLDWQLYTDWRVKPQNGQETFSDLYSDLVFRPRSWIRFESQTRFDLNLDGWNFLLHTVTLQPNDVWSWTIGHFYLKDDFSTSPTALGQGDDAIMSAFFYRLNENWSTRAVHQYDVRSGRLQEQYYSLYRDFRSWTAAITGGIRNNGVGPIDYSIGFTFSFKALPKFGVGADTVRPYEMLGLQNQVKNEE